MIFCWRSGKCYVGSSKNIHWRWYCHRNSLRQCEHYCKHLQNAWDKHGEHAFYLIVLETCTEDERFRREQFYLDAAGPRDLYNTSKLALCPASTPEICKGRSERAKAQHAAGTFGRASWTDSSRRNFSRNSHGNSGPRSLEILEKMRQGKRAYWTPERRQEQAERARAQQLNRKLPK